MFTTFVCWAFKGSPEWADDNRTAPLDQAFRIGVAVVLDLLLIGRIVTYLM